MRPLVWRCCQNRLLVKLPFRVADVQAVPLNGASFVSAYSGCGGMDIGFRLAGFEPVWANELNVNAVDTYVATLGDHAVPGDINEIKWPARGADLVIGGPPCQGFSVAGKMNPSDPRSEHVRRFLDLVERVRPNAFVMENVKALAVSARWEAVRAGLEQRAHELGFKTSLLVLNAADFGVPQRRERMFLIGSRTGRPPSELAPSVGKHRAVAGALRHLPAYGEPGNDTVCTAVITPAKRPILRPSAYQGSLLFNGNGRPLQLDRPAPTLPASMGGNATPILDQNELETGEESWVVAYHRRLLNGGKPLKRVPDYLGRITVEEAAQLQGFPLGMEFAGSTSAKYHQIGNAVPPPLAYAVAQAIAVSIGLVASEPPERLAA